MRPPKFIYPGLFIVLSGSLLCINYAIERSQFGLMLGLYALAFAAYFIIVNSGASSKDLDKLVAFSLVLRLAMVFSIPVLSDDFYRFIWDGQVTLSGTNPYLHYPTEYIVNPELLPLLNSPNYYTVYPPLCQVIFLSSAAVSGGDVYLNVVALKLFILLFEAGSIFMLRNLLRNSMKNENLVLLYALNPLIILEFFSGLHFEAGMIFFVLAALWLLSKSERPIMMLYSALCFAGAICIKLWPVLLLPLFFRRIGIIKMMLYGSMTLIFVCLMFLPFWDENLIPNIGESLGKYFNWFEFNASFFNLFKYTDRSWQWWSLPALKIIGGVTLLYLYILYDRTYKSIFGLFVLVFTLYFATSTTIHPWYITPIIAFAVLSPWRYVYLWSFLIVTTYSAYIGKFDELEWVLWIEYLAVFGYMVYEIVYQKKHKVQEYGI